MLTVMGSAGSHAVRERASTHSSQCQDKSAIERTRLIEALSDLHNLLEEYAPAWYTEEHHRKAESALHASREY
jgi:hypothetical protein